MVIPIIYPSAVQFWLDSRNQAIVEKCLFAQRKQTNLPEVFSIENDSKVLSIVTEQLHIHTPISLMASSSAGRHRNTLIKSYTREEKYPPFSFIEAGTYRFHSRREDCTILVAGPELCFLQAAKKLTIYELVKLGFDLCAKYIYDKNAQYLQKNREPLTSVLKITEFLNQSDRVRGIKNARKAIKYVLDNSNSPAETMLAMTGRLPLSMGGGSLGKCELNKDVKLSPEGAKVLGAETCNCDEVWEEKKVIVEYDSNQTHLDKDQHAWDKKKATALSLSGYKVFYVTAANIRNPYEMAKIFSAIRTALGKKNRRDRLEKYADQRTALFRFFLENRL